MFKNEHDHNLAKIFLSVYIYILWLFNYEHYSMTGNQYFTITGVCYQPSLSMNFIGPKNDIGIIFGSSNFNRKYRK